MMAQDRTIVAKGMSFDDFEKIFSKIDVECEFTISTSGGLLHIDFLDEGDTIIRVYDLVKRTGAIVVRIE